MPGGARNKRNKQGKGQRRPPPVHEKSGGVTQVALGVRALKEVTKELKAPKQRQGGPRPQGFVRTMTRSKASALVRGAVPAMRTKVEAALGQFADPVSYVPTRLPDVTSISSVGTAATSISIVETLHWPLTTLPVSELPTLPDGVITEDPLSRLVVLMRDPVVMGIVQDSTFPSSAGQTLMSIHTPIQWRFLSHDIFKPIFTHQTWRSGPKRYGEWQPVAHVAGTQAFWVDANPTLQAGLHIDMQVVDDFGVAGQEVMVVLTRHLSESDTEEAAQGKFNMVAPGGGIYFGPMLISNAGYYSISLRLAAGNTGMAANRWLTLDATVWTSSGTGLVHRHVVHPDISSSDGRMVQDIRVLGAAFLASNVTAEFFKGGQVYAQQIYQRAIWYEGCANAAQITANNLRLIHDGPLSKGIYGFAKPQGLDALSMRPAIDLVEDSELGTKYVHYLYTPFHVPGQCQFLMIPLDSSAQAAQGSCTLTVHFTRSMEYTSGSQIITLGSAQISRSALLVLLDRLDDFPQFYENPLHLAQIRAKMAQAGRWTWENRSMLLTIATLVAKLAALA